MFLSSPFEHQNTLCCFCRGLPTPVFTHTHGKKPQHNCPYHFPKYLSREVGLHLTGWENPGDPGDKVQPVRQSSKPQAWEEPPLALTQKQRKDGG